MQKLTLVLIFFLVSCSSQAPSKKSGLTLIPLEGLEGLSGLSFAGTNSSNELIFWSHTDRGPNATEIMDPKLGQKRPFIKPDFIPYWIQFSVNQKTKEVRILKKIEINLSGLPNTNLDEIPVNMKGDILPRDLMGVDPEAICFDGEHVWMGEEYRPSILKFSLDGKLLRRFVPEGSFTVKEMNHPKLRGIVSQNLPGNLKFRKLNRGFEGLACSKDKVFAILQSPLTKEKHEVILVELDSKKEVVIKTYDYPLNPVADKIGDLVLGDNTFYAIEQNGGIGPSSFHSIFQFRLDNLVNNKIQKELTVDLVKAGYDFADKIEGLSLLKDGSIVIVNDNDFGVEGNGINPLRKSVMGIIKP